MRRRGATVMNGSKDFEPVTGGAQCSARPWMKRITRRSGDTSGIDRLRQKP